MSQKQSLQHTALREVEAESMCRGILEPRTPGAPEKVTEMRGRRVQQVSLGEAARTAGGTCTKAWEWEFCFVKEGNTVADEVGPAGRLQTIKHPVLHVKG